MDKKKYLLFAGHFYYPEGGMCDLYDTGDSVDELMRVFEEQADDIAGNSGYIDNWGHIVDSETLGTVCHGVFRLKQKPIWSAVKER